MNTAIIPPHDRRERYFLKLSVIEGDEGYQEVTRSQFGRAERSAGFFPKGGGGYDLNGASARDDGQEPRLATGGFSGNGVSGRIVTEWSFDSGKTWDRADLALAKLRESA